MRVFYGVDPVLLHDTRVPEISLHGVDTTHVADA